jgi:hypothetical protein
MGDWRWEDKGFKDTNYLLRLDRGSTIYLEF